MRTKMREIQIAFNISKVICKYLPIFILSRICRSRRAIISTALLLDDNTNIRSFFFISWLKSNCKMIDTIKRVLPVPGGPSINDKLLLESNDLL